MPETVKLQIGDKKYLLPVVVGSMGERAIDIRRLREDTQYITLDRAT
jgi:citrate synthase